MKKRMAIGTLMLLGALTQLPLAHASETKTNPINPPLSQGLLNINKATVEQLSQLKGIGHTKATAIINYRNQIGEFGSVDELKAVKGIGDKLISKLRHQVTV